MTEASLLSKNARDFSGPSEALLLTVLLHPWRAVDIFFLRNWLRICSVSPGNFMNSHCPVLNTFPLKNCHSNPCPQGTVSVPMIE